MPRKYEYLRRTYDNESSLDYDLTKLGLMGWMMCGIVRYSPTPARVQYMVWYIRELGKEKSNTTKFLPPQAPVIGEGVPRVIGDPLADPVNWPDITPDENPFDNDDYDIPLPGEEEY